LSNLTLKFKFYVKTGIEEEEDSQQYP